MCSSEQQLHEHKIGHQIIGNSNSNRTFEFHIKEEDIDLKLEEDINIPAAEKRQKRTKKPGYIIRYKLEYNSVFQYSMLFENIRVLFLGRIVIIETSPKVFLYVISDNILRGKYSLNFME